MTVLELLTLVNQVLFVGLFVAVAWRALRQPSRPNIDASILFGAIAGVVLLGYAARALGVDDAPWLGGLALAAFNVVPWAMLRLVDDFRGTPRWVQAAGVAVLLVLGAGGFLALESSPIPVELATGAWFLVVGGYGALEFAHAAAESWGLTRWRMGAIATGAILFVVAILLVVAAAVVPETGPRIALSVVVQLMALGSATAFYLGFAPPSWLRRAWREPHLRHFLERSAQLSGVADDNRMVLQLQHAVAATMGSSGATLAVAGEDGTRLHYVRDDGQAVDFPAEMFIAGRSFSRRERIVAPNAPAIDPANAEMYAASDATVVIAVPIITNGESIGSLSVFGGRAPIFIEEDLWLLELLADQTALILETRRTARVASELRGREEATRLKEEFLSSAAHDLRTPLTVILGQAELLERRLQRDPDAHVDPAGIGRMARESRRLRDLVSDLLDAQRIEEGAVTFDRQPTDLRVVIQAALERHQDHGIGFQASLGDVALVSSVDRMRVEQVLDNLIENAGRYGVGSETPEVRASSDGTEARISVIDHGIGIPDDERAHVFDRFYRASNAQARSDTGLGLGLYICRTIVEAHDGRIWTDPTPGGGSTFHLALPLGPSDAGLGDAVTDERITRAGPTEAAADA